MDKKKVIFSVIPCAIAIALGVSVGYYFGKQFLGVTVDYSSVNAEDLEDNINNLYSTYKSTSEDKYFSNFKHYEIVNISLKKLSEVEYFSTTGIGAANASGIVQSVNDKFIKYKDSYFDESISNSSLVHVAKRFYQDSDSIDVYNGSVTSSTSASFDENSKEIYTLEKFEEEWGKTLTRGSIYIISSKTVEEGTITQNEDGNYEIYLKLDPTLSVMRYVKQMKKISDLGDYPVFSNVELTFTVDKTLTLLSSYVNENYEVNKIGKHATNGTLTTTYNYEISEIPDLDKNCSYD